MAEKETKKYEVTLIEIISFFILAFLTGGAFLLVVGMTYRLLIILVIILLLFLIPLKEHKKISPLILLILVVLIVINIHSYAFNILYDSNCLSQYAKSHCSSNKLYFAGLDLGIFSTFSFKCNSINPEFSLPSKVYTSNTDYKFPSEELSKCQNLKN